MRRSLVISKLGFAFALVALASGCQTPNKTKIANLEKVQIGMDKAQVLDTTGFGPRYSDRRDGQDRWIFEVYPNRVESATVEKEVRFQEGKVVYVGGVQKPSISAEEQDRLNETAKSDNVAIEDSLRREGRKGSIDLKEELSKSMPKKQNFQEVVPVDEATSTQPAPSNTSR